MTFRKFSMMSQAITGLCIAAIGGGMAIAANPGIGFALIGFAMMWSATLGNKTQ